MGGAARRHLEIAIYRPLEVETFEFAVDQHRGRTVGLQHHSSAKLGKLGLARRRLGRSGKHAQPRSIAGAGRQADVAGPAAANASIEALGFGDDGEPVLGGPDGLRIAEQQQAAFAQGKMEDRGDFRLRFGAQVDQKVAARNEVETRERRVRQHVLHREHHAGAQLGRDPVGMIFSREKRGQSTGRNVGLDRLGIEAFTSARHRIRVDIAGEDLQFDVAFRGVDLFTKQHGEGIRLFPGTATGDPDPQRSIRGVIAHQVGNGVLLQKLEYRRVTKETRDIDQQIPGELIAFVGVAMQEIQILGRGLDRRHRHPPLDAAFESAMLVMGEIVNRLRPQEIDDLRQQSLHRILRAQFPRRRRQGRALFAADERLGDLRRGEHEVHRARRDGALGHAVIVGFVELLRDDEAAFRLYRRQANAAVGAGSREDHADGARAIFARQRIQQEVEREARAVTLLRSRNPQRPFVDGKIDARRNDIDVLAFDRHSVGRLRDRHRGVARQQTHHHAVVAGVEVLDEYEGHAIARRQRVQQLLAGLEAAGRSANRDDREIRRGCWRKGVFGSNAAAPPWRAADDFQALGYFSRTAALQSERSNNLIAQSLRAEATCLSCVGRLFPTR